MRVLVQLGCAVLLDFTWPRRIKWPLESHYALVVDYISKDPVHGAEYWGMVNFTQLPTVLPVEYIQTPALKDVWRGTKDDFAWVLRPK
jgi:hypothetical protein